MPHRSALARLLLALCLALLMPLGARAGSGGANLDGVAKYGEPAIRDFTLRLNDELDRRSVTVALLARAGRARSELPPGIAYTHVAFAVFEAVRTPAGTVGHTYTVYNLYQGAGGRDDRSYLAQDFTYDFLAGILEPDIAVCVPVPDLQQQLLAVLRSPAYAALHNPAYNLAANPAVDRFDNCVTHALKICLSAIYGTADRARLYANARAYFRPTPVHLGPLRTLGAAFMPALSREDMDPAGLRTATYESLAAFLATHGLVQEQFTLRLR